MNTYSFMVSNSSELSLHIVGGYGILAIPSKLAVQSWQSRYGRDAIPSYRLPFIYKDKYLSNSSELSLHIVGGYGILAIPTK